jgi:DNA-binding transcriptional regulator LsrR (DeoR family)
MSGAQGNEATDRLDLAARAGWLYYVAGRKQDEIAVVLGVSRQTAQRLVSLAVANHLVRVHIQHPIAKLLELAARLKSELGLRFAEVVPSDPLSDSTTVGVAEAGAAEIERRLRETKPAVFATGTGRTLKAAIDLLPQMNCPQHRIVSIAGNIAPDGSASYYNVIFTIADASRARSYPMPMPVVASSEEERDRLHSLPLVATALGLAGSANVAFIGIGDLSDTAPLYLDGFISRDELACLRKVGAVGEICGWAFDADGHFVDGLTNARIASGSLPSTATCEVIALAKGQLKLPGIRAAITGKLINGLITDEATAEALVA